MKIRDVVQAWKSGRPGKTSNGSLSTDGSQIWSYQSRIGFTDNTTAENVKIALDRHAISQTTTSHVNLVKAMADEVAHPALVVGLFEKLGLRPD